MTLTPNQSTTPPTSGPPSWPAPASPQPGPTAKGHRRWLIPTGALLLGLVMGSASHGSGSTTGGTAGAASTATVTSTVASTATVTETDTVTAEAPEADSSSTAAPAASSGIPGDGTYSVGSDIKAGTYRSPTPASGNCYWARLKDTSGGFGSIITNGNSAGQVTVTIRKSDGAFESNGCSDWVRVK